MFLSKNNMQDTVNLYIYGLYAFTEEKYLTMRY